LATKFILGKCYRFLGRPFNFDQKGAVFLAENTGDGGSLSSGVTLYSPDHTEGKTWGGATASLYEELSDEEALLYKMT
jgi:hypothetical protein